MELALSLPRPRRFWPSLSRALVVHRSRRGLAALDDHMLQDIGLTRAEAETEASRPAWDAPGHWQRR